MTCVSCTFFRPHVVGDGICHRFPQIISKGPHDWCGEHKQREVLEINIVEDTPQEPPKKRGRKPKDVE